MSSARQPHPGTRRVRNLLTIPDAANRSGQAESHCGVGSSCSENIASHQRVDDRDARPLVRFSRNEIGRYLSPRIFATRPAPEKGSLERFADGDEGTGVEGAHKNYGIGTGFSLSSV